MRPDLRIVVANDLSPMPLGHGIDHYLLHIGNRGASRNTVLAYGSDLQHFVRFVHRLGQGTLVAVLSSRHVSRFLDDQTAQGISLNSQARRLSTLRMFFRHARREGWISHDPTQDERVKVKRVRKIAPELPQFHALIDAIPRDGAANLRDRALLRLLLDTGVRISAICGADIPGANTHTSIDLRRGLLHFVNKGGDDETTPFNDATGRMLEAWLAKRHLLAQDGLLALFVGARGERLSRGSAHHVIKARGRAVGLDLHSHLFRHRRIADVVETCGDKIGQQFAHHASLQSTSGYGHHANNVAFDLLRSRADIDRGRARA